MTQTTQDGFTGVGVERIKCSEEGKWSSTDFFCSTNTALRKPTFYNSNSSQTGSVKAVDGDYEDGGSVYECDQLDEVNKILSIDLQETVRVRAFRISSHSSGSVINNIEVIFNNNPP